MGTKQMCVRLLCPAQHVVREEAACLRGAGIHKVGEMQLRTERLRSCLLSMREQSRLVFIFLNTRGPL